MRYLTLLLVCIMTSGVSGQPVSRDWAAQSAPVQQYTVSLAAAPSSGAVTKTVSTASFTVAINATVSQDPTDFDPHPLTLLYSINGGDWHGVQMSTVAQECVTSNIDCPWYGRLPELPNTGDEARFYVKATVKSFTTQTDVFQRRVVDSKAFVLEWKEMSLSGGQKHSYQVRMYADTGEFEYRYSQWSLFFSGVAHATIGWQSLDKTKGSTILQAGDYDDGLGIPKPSLTPENPSRQHTGGAKANLLFTPDGRGAVSYTHLTLPTICSV